MSVQSFKRRTLIKGALAGALSPLAAIQARAQSLQGLTIGIVYVGPRTDFGWNASHYVGVQALKNLPGVKVVEQERVPENPQVYEVEPTNSLVDAGCDVIGVHVDSPKIVIETAERRGVKSCGHNVSQASVGPKGFITGAELKYETIYKRYAEILMKGERLPNMMVGGYDTDMVQNTPFGAGASEPARKAALAAIADLKAGKPIFTGTWKDNAGKVVLDKTYDNYDPVLDRMNYLL